MRIDALADLVPVLARGKRRRLDDTVIEQMRPYLAADFDHVAKASSRNESGDRATPFNDEVGRDCSAVANMSNFGRLDRMLLEQIGDALLDRLRRIARRRGHLVIADLPVFLAQKREVSKGAADVDTDSIPIQA